MLARTPARHTRRCDATANTRVRLFPNVSVCGCVVRRGDDHRSGAGPSAGARFSAHFPSAGKLFSMPATTHDFREARAQSVTRRKLRPGRRASLTPRGASPGGRPRLSSWGRSPPLRTAGTSPRRSGNSMVGDTGTSRGGVAPPAASRLTAARCRVPFEDPVCAPDGTVMDIMHAVPYVQKHGKHPVTGEPLELKRPHEADVPQEPGGGVRVPGAEQGVPRQPERPGSGAPAHRRARTASPAIEVLLRVPQRRWRAELTDAKFARGGQATSPTARAVELRSEGRQEGVTTPRARSRRTTWWQGRRAARRFRAARGACWRSSATFLRSPPRASLGRRWARRRRLRASSPPRGWSFSTREGGRERSLAPAESAPTRQHVFRSVARNGRRLATCVSLPGPRPRGGDRHDRSSSDAEKRRRPPRTTSARAACTGAFSAHEARRPPCPPPEPARRPARPPSTAARGDGDSGAMRACGGGCGAHPRRRRDARVTTSRGDLNLELHCDVAPRKGCENFPALADGHPTHIAFAVVGKNRHGAGRATAAPSAASGSAGERSARCVSRTEALGAPCVGSMARRGAAEPTARSSSCAGGSAAACGDALGVGVGCGARRGERRQDGPSRRRAGRPSPSGGSRRVRDACVDPYEDAARAEERRRRVTKRQDGRARRPARWSVVGPGGLVVQPLGRRARGAERRAPERITPLGGGARSSGARRARRGARRRNATSGCRRGTKMAGLRARARALTRGGAASGGEAFLLNRPSRVSVRIKTVVGFSVARFSGGARDRRGAPARAFRLLPPPDASAARRRPLDPVLETVGPSTPRRMISAVRSLHRGPPERLAVRPRGRRRARDVARANPDSATPDDAPDGAFARGTARSSRMSLCVVLGVVPAAAGGSCGPPGAARRARSTGGSPPPRAAATLERAHDRDRAQRRRAQMRAELVSSAAADRWSASSASSARCRAAAFSGSPVSSSKSGTSSRPPIPCRAARASARMRRRRSRGACSRFVCGCTRAWCSRSHAAVLWRPP